ncbi:MAG: twin-arginine translocase subunit TatC [Candidatus Omnitrophica bacterium]|nr:twin-arginine translocase subunit TatC [Candidatus Omnitrophota bacterium]
MDKKLTFTGHLEEFRQRLLVTLVVLLTITGVAFNHVDKILLVLKAPAAGSIDKLVFFSPTEAFLVYFKIAFLTAVMLSSPLIFYQVWAFVSPAIGEDVKKRGGIFLVLTVLAFLAGVSFGYFMLLPAAIKFLIGFSGGVLVPMISVGEYTSFVIGLLLGCGLVFEMPVLSFLLAKAGVLQYWFLRKNWKYAVIIIFIVAAIVTPTPDAFNMTLLAIPMLILYEISIWVVKFNGKDASHQKDEAHE